MNESDHSLKDGYAPVYITSSQISITDKKGMPQYKVVYPNQQLLRGTMPLCMSTNQSISIHPTAENEKISTRPMDF